MNLIDIFENISPQQRRVGQLPANFNPPNTSPQLAGSYPGRNATRGYLVGEATESEGYNNLRAVLQAVNTRSPAELMIGGEPITLDYMEARFLNGIYKAYLSAGRQAEFIQDLTNMRRFDQHMKRLRDLIAKQRNFRGSIPGERKVDEAVGDDNPMAAAVIRRILHGRLDLLQKYGAEAVLRAVEDVTEGDTDWEEIGSSDVSAYVRYVEQQLQDRMGSREDMNESATTTEDVLSVMKKKLGDYLQDVATAIKTDPALKDKLPTDLDQIKAVKTITTDDGKEIKITGNEDDGFRISIRNRELPTSFKTLDEATMASEMYCSHRRTRAMEADYIEEKQGISEGLLRVDSLVTDALKIMRGPTMNDAIAALKTVLGDREYNGRRGHYNFYVRQLIDMYGQQGVAEGSEDRRRFIRHNIWTAMDSDEEVLQHTVEGDPFYSAKKFMRDLDDQGYDFTHVISPKGEITYSPQHDPRHLKNFPDQGVAEGSALDNYRQRVNSQGFTDSPGERDADRSGHKRRHQDALNRISDISGGSSDEERAHQAQQRMARDEYKLDRLKRSDDDWEKTFDMMRDRLNRYQRSSQRDVDPEQLAAISNIKYEPRQKNEAVQAKTDDKLLAYYAQRKAEKQKQQGVAEDSTQVCPECGGPSFSNLVLAEKQDACYHKVRGRYKVWPSAYASGALVQCRKKGAANWGNKS